MVRRACVHWSSQLQLIVVDGTTPPFEILDTRIQRLAFRFPHRPLLPEQLPFLIEQAALRFE